MWRSAWTLRDLCWPPVVRRRNDLRKLELVSMVQSASWMMFIREQTAFKKCHDEEEDLKESPPFRPAAAGLDYFSEPPPGRRRRVLINTWCKYQNSFMFCTRTDQSGLIQWCHDRLTGSGRRRPFNSLQSRGEVAGIRRSVWRRGCLIHEDVLEKRKKHFVHRFSFFYQQNVCAPQFVCFLRF